MAHPSLLSVVQDALEQFAPVSLTESAHPLSITYTTVTAQLNALLNTTHHLNHALNQINDLPLGENATKLVALMKEHTSLTSSINQSATASLSLSSLVQGGNRVIYPDTSPPDPTKIAEWGRNLGMETFVDGSTTVLAGKVLVLDIDINDHVAVKTSFANSNNNTGSASAAPELDIFLAREVTRWIYAARCAAGIHMISGPSKEDPAIEAARRSREIQQHFRYLMMLDALAAAENEKGLRWFMEPTFVADHIRKQVAASPQIQTLDKLLMQHALPLPFIVTPSLSFLVWLSPRAYLQILRSSPSSKQSSMWNIDIPIAHLKISLQDMPEDVTIATMKLIPSTEVASSKINLPSDVSGDHLLLTAPSHMWVLDFTAKLPQNGVVMSQSRMRVVQGIIELHSVDLNSGLGNMSGMGTMSSLGGMSNMNFGEFGVPSQVNGGGEGAGSSWFELLLNKNSSAEYYSAIYQSPSGIHPPLHLRLLAPQEPGFLLQRVPVRSVNQALRVLEVVREQCWLNESLSIPKWSPEHEQQPHQRQPNVRQGMQPEDAVSHDLLASVLAGTATPHSIPVNVYLPSNALPLFSQSAAPFTAQHSGLGMAPPASAGSSSGSLFGSGDLEMDMEIPGLSMSMGGSVAVDMDLGMDLTTPVDSIMRQQRGPETCPPSVIVLSSPSPVHKSGLIEIRVTLAGRHGSVVGENAVRVEASPGVETSYMPDVVRRGGVWSLPGRVWGRV